MRKDHLGVFTVCIFILIPISIPQNAGLFKTFHGLRIRNPTVILSQDQSTDSTECCISCVAYEDCYGANYHENDRVCEINTPGPQGIGQIIDRNETWTLYFRPNGNGVGVKDTWLGTNTSTPSQDTCNSMTSRACATHYRNPKVDFWERLSILEVHLELYTGGSRVAFVTFSGKGSNIKSWMSPERLLSSSWTTLNSSMTYFYFSVDGHGSCARNFFIQRNYGGCENDAGWFVTLDPPGVCCAGSWDDLSNKPTFMYSTVNDAVVYQNGSGVGIADVMAIFVKYS
ncbi:uncharacterized protein LOC134250404 isoform X2 [Saccostrea cucullata]|uniref:uncharacterized protein LOC134250404 isoform X2 n=1 Tax=Saccostrea cuccullata TaxID=36930 RepID=UPI002ED6968B